jgi:ankyrin repeat protein
MLIEAVRAGNVSAVRALLTGDPARANEEDGSGATALHLAAENGHREVVRLLIEHGANVNARDGRFDATPTGWAIEYLRQLGGYLTIELEDMAHAIETRNVHWVKRFLRRFPQLRTADYKNGVTFCDLARDCGDAEIARLFTSSPSPTQTDS